jgi:dynein assembly factor 3, axonemal
VCSGIGLLLYRLHIPRWVETERVMTDAIIKSLGHHALWGLSATFDFVEAIEAVGITHIDPNEPINILLLHPGDIRHIIYTLSRKRRHSSRPVHFYLLESTIEILARDLLLLEVFLDFEVPIRQRANVFLEIFGNAKVQERTARYIEQLGQKLVNLAVNSVGTLGLVDLQHLRYRERDGLEAVFKSYSRNNPCDMANLRDQRLRGYYAERYDSRRALGDWDWQYSYRETAASLVHLTLYRDWRETGIAFEFGDQRYEEGNRTMMTYVEGTMKRGKDAGFHKEVNSPSPESLSILTLLPIDQGLLV